MTALLTGTALFLTINVAMFGVWTFITWATERHHNLVACIKRHPATRSKGM